MRKLIDTDKVFDALKAIKNLKSDYIIKGDVQIGTIYNHGGDYPNYICTGIEFSNGNVKVLSCRRISVKEDKVEIGTSKMHTTFPSTMNIVAYDGVEYIEKLLAENPKKAILEKQIKELETKLGEMKSEVKSM